MIFIQLIFPKYFQLKLYNFFSYLLIIKYNPLNIKIPHKNTFIVIISPKIKNPKNEAMIGSPKGTDITTVVGKNLSEYDSMPCPRIVGIIPKK